VAHSASITSLDPHFSSQANIAIYRALFDAPFNAYFNPERKSFEVRPELFESWSAASPTTVLFKIRQGVKFHDGSVLTSEVAAFNLNRMVSHKRSNVKTHLEGVKNAERVDATTVKVNLQTPLASLPMMLAGNNGGVSFVSQVAVEKLGEERYGQQAVGSGAFRLESRSADRVTVKKYEGYWQSGQDARSLPYLDSVVFRQIPLAAQPLIELQKGSIEVLEGLEARDAAMVKTDPALVLHEAPATGQIFFYGGFNTQSGPFAKDVRIRQALAHAIDRVGMAKALAYGMGRPLLYPLTAPGILGYDPSIRAYPYDPDKARQLLAEAGFPSGPNITLLSARTTEPALGDLVKQMFDQVGFRTTFDQPERMAFYTRLATHNFDLAYWRGNLPPDPHFNARSFYGGGLGNLTGFKDNEVDKCLDDGRTETDSAKRQQIYRLCTSLIQEKAYLFTGYLVPDCIASRKEVRDIGLQGSMVDLRGVWVNR
jgi:peptide/nickel transport system substrate-binding protein